MSTPYNREIKAIVIHHMGDSQPPEVPIRQRWNPAGYDYPEYDYGIEGEGTVRVGRPLNYVGAHTQSDKESYRSRGSNWWNKNAIGIGLAGDFTKYPMTKAQFKALVPLVKQLMLEHKLTLDDVYPHGQVTYTDCPGCTYSKVPALKGSWSYDEFEKAVMAKEEEDVLVHAVVYYTTKDFSSALMVADKLGGCATFCRNASAAIHMEAKTAKHLVIIGGPECTDHSNVTNCCGAGAPETAILAAQYAQKL